jgi:hypothetical protein
MLELKAPRKTGHWLRNDVPQSGWRCVGIEERKGGTVICQMCEVTEVVYVHRMVHDDLLLVELSCGYACAAHMTGNAEQERLREVHYAWLAAVRANRTPIQKIKRKRWKGDHSVLGVHKWTMQVDPHKYMDQFIVEVRNKDGWCYSLRRHWWVPAYGAPVLYLHGGPFDSDVEAAVASISHAELLLANSQWMANDYVSEILHKKAAKAEQDAKDTLWGIRNLIEEDCPELAEAVGMDRMSLGKAFQEQRARWEAQRLVEHAAKGP